MHNLLKWTGTALFAFAVLANFGTYSIFPLSGGLWTVLGGAGVYLFAKPGHK